MVLKTLAELKAGKMSWDGKTVSPMNTPGKLLLTESAGVQRILWWDREANKKSENDNWVVKKDAYLEQVTKCSDGRVYVLKWLKSRERMFFWLQDPKAEGEGAVSKFNEMMGTPVPVKKPVQTASAASGLGAATSSGAPAAGPNNMTPQQTQALQQQLLQLLQSGGGVGAGQAPSRVRVPLSKILTPELLLSLLESPEDVAKLVEKLPADQQTEAQLKENIHAPQLKGNMTPLTEAVYSDQVMILFSSLGLTPPAGLTDPMEALCKALEDKHKQA